jgi:DNA polymerase-3 subunit alpha
MMAGLEKAMQSGSTLQEDKQKGQMNFFGNISPDDYTQDHKKLPKVQPWPESRMLAYEKDVLGFYVTSNPLSHCAETIHVYSTINSSGLAEYNHDRDVVIGGMVTRIRYHITKKGRNAGSKMAVFILEDLQGTAEVVLFAEVLKKFENLLIEDAVIFVKGTVDHRREKPNIFASELIELEQATEKLATKVNIKLDSKNVTKERIAEIKSICQHHKGKSQIYISVETNKGKVQLQADRTLCVKPDVEFCKKIKQLVGEKNLKLLRS